MQTPAFTTIQASPAKASNLPHIFPVELWAESIQ